MNNPGHLGQPRERIQGFRIEATSLNRSGGTLYVRFTGQEHGHRLYAAFDRPWPEVKIGDRFVASFQVSMHQFSGESALTNIVDVELARDPAPAIAHGGEFIGFISQRIEGLELVVRSAGALKNSNVSILHCRDESGRIIVAFAKWSGRHGSQVNERWIVNFKVAKHEIRNGIRQTTVSDFELVRMAIAPAKSV